MDVPVLAESGTKAPKHYTAPSLSPQPENTKLSFRTIMNRINRAISIAGGSFAAVMIGAASFSMSYAADLERSSGRQLTPEESAEVWGIFVGKIGLFSGIGSGLVAGGLAIALEGMNRDEKRRMALDYIDSQIARPGVLPPEQLELFANIRAIAGGTEA